MAENIYPIFEKMLQRKDREALLKQKGIMIWFTGLSGSGKSTLAIAGRGIYINKVYSAVSWMETISAVASIITWVFRKPTERKIFVA